MPSEHPFGLFSWTFLRSIYDIDKVEQRTSTWPELVKLFTEHQRYWRKDEAPGFGGYHLIPSPPCVRHEGAIRTEPHRCGASIDHMSLLVFDVDIGRPEQIDHCTELLTKAGVAHVWYSSFSYTPEKELPPFRLVIPPSQRIFPQDYKQIREATIRQFEIPADITKCGGLSHFWYLPSAKLTTPNKQSPVLFQVGEGQPLDVSTLELFKGLTPSKASARSPLTKFRFDWSPPPEPEGPVDLKPLKDRLEKLSAKFARGTGTKSKGQLLRALLDGQPLAEHGNRNSATTITAGIVAFALTGMDNASLGVLLHLFRPSLNAMIAAGSKLTESTVERMLFSSMCKKAEADAIAEAEREERNRENTELMKALKGQSGASASDANENDPAEVNAAYLKFLEGAAARGASK